MSPIGASHKQLGQLLLEAGVIDDLQLRSALGHQRQWGGRLGRILLELKFVDEATLAATLAKQLGLESTRIRAAQVLPKLLQFVPQAVAERHWIFPVAFQDGRGGGELTLAVSDPTNLVAVEDIRFHTGKRIKIVVAAESEIEAAIKRFYYGDGGVVLPADQEASSQGPEEDLAELEPIEGEAQAPAAPDPLAELFDGMTGPTPVGEQAFDFSAPSLEGEVEEAQAPPPPVPEPIQVGASAFDAPAFDAPPSEPMATLDDLFMVQPGVPTETQPVAIIPPLEAVPPPEELGIRSSPTPSRTLIAGLPAIPPERGEVPAPPVARPATPPPPLPVARPAPLPVQAAPAPVAPPPVPNVLVSALVPPDPDVEVSFDDLNEPDPTDGGLPSIPPLEIAIPAPPAKGFSAASVEVSPELLGIQGPDVPEVAVAEAVPVVFAGAAAAVAEPEPEVSEVALDVSEPSAPPPEAAVAGPPFVETPAAEAVAIEPPPVEAPEAAAPIAFAPPAESQVEAPPPDVTPPPEPVAPLAAEAPPAPEVHPAAAERAADGVRLTDGELQILDSLEARVAQAGEAPQIVKPGELVSALIRLLISKGLLAEAELIEELQKH